jgi:hypothetical protein
MALWALVDVSQALFGLLLLLQTLSFAWRNSPDLVYL